MKTIAFVALACASAASAATLESPSLALLFDSPERGFAVTGLVCRAEGGTCFRTASGGKTADFWELRFSGGPGGEAKLQNHNPSRRSMHRLPCGGAAFRWEGLSLPGAPEAVDVEAKVSFSEDGASEWTLAVSNRATNGWALAYTSYPHLRGVLPAGECDALVPTMNLGARFVRGFRAEALSPRSYSYPGWYPMVTAFQRGAAGLYMAAHDREARIKTLTYDRDGTVRFETPVEDMGVAGKAAEGPRYPVVIAAYSGDWWAAARLYRRFAMTCPWTAKGPIARRADYPKAMAETPLWCRISDSVESATNLTAWTLARWPDLKPGFQWYNWNIQPFDTDYPEFRAQPGVAGHLARCRAKGVLAMPYINGRLWDAQLMSFPYACREACARQDGSPQIERYGHDFAVMCPFCRGWQDILLRQGTNVVEGLGANAIYYDQVTCARPMLCFNPTHGHAVGGGKWWAEGYRRAFERIHDRLAPQNVPITSEGAGEFLLDLVDGHLICGRVPLADDVPFLPAVYSGYTVFFGCEIHSLEPPHPFFVRVAQATLWGCATGRWQGYRYFRPGLPDSQQQRTAMRHVADIAAMARIRMAAADFLVYGHLEDELRLLDAPPSVTVEWRKTRVKKGPSEPPPTRVELPAVIGTVWRDVRGERKAVFAVNISEAERTVRFTCKGKPAVMRLPGQPAPGIAAADGIVSLTVAPGTFAGVEFGLSVAVEGK